MYFCDTIIHYMRKKSYSMCIFEIANYQMKLEKKYGLKNIVMEWATNLINGLKKYHKVKEK